MYVRLYTRAETIQRGGANHVFLVTNSLMRTTQALLAGKVSVEGSIFPGGLSLQLASVPGAHQFSIPQGGSIPQALLNLLPSFEKH